MPEDARAGHEVSYRKRAIEFGLASVVFLLSYNLSIATSDTVPESSQTVMMGLVALFAVLSFLSLIAHLGLSDRGDSANG